MTAKPGRLHVGVCKLFGLDPMKVTSMRLDIDAGEPPMLNVRRIVEGDEILFELKRYRLVERE